MYMSAPDTSTDGGDPLDMVNADLGELLQAHQYISSAVTNIENTKRFITQSYRQLGYSWRDRKYQDLGNVVQKCSNALDEILRVLYAGEKFVGALAKSLQDYEDVELRSSAISANTDNSGTAVQSEPNSLSAEVQKWTAGLEELSERLYKIYSDRYSYFISKEKLERPLKDTVVYETPEEFLAQGMDRRVLGFNNGKKSHVRVGSGHELQTTVHENLHQLSADENKKKYGLVFYDENGNKKNVGLNEAITELLTMRTLGTDYGKDYSAYSQIRNTMEHLAEYMGEDTICRAYFQNQPELLQNLFDSALGEGYWEKLSTAFDNSLSDNPDIRANGLTERNDLIDRYARTVNNDWGDIICIEQFI